MRKNRREGVGPAPVYDADMADDNPSPTHTGGCLCGGVRFRIAGEVPAIQVCHCGQCRRAQGGPFATNIPIDGNRFTLTAGGDLLTDFESSPGKHRVFCRRCGSPVYSARDSLPGVVRVRAGLMDEPFHAPIGLHFHTASKAGWWTIADDAPQFEAGHSPPPPSTDAGDTR